MPRLIAYGGAVLAASLVLPTGMAEAADSWGVPKVLDRDRVGPPAVAMAENKGTATAHWIDAKGQAHVARFADGRWQKPDPFGSRGRVANLRIRESDDGRRALAVWGQPRPDGKFRTILAAVRNGNRWSRPATVMSATGGRYRDFRVAVSRDAQRAVVVAEAAVRGNPQLSSLYSATLRGTRWATPRLVTQQGEISDVQLVMDPDATRSVLAYQTSSGQGDPERIVVRDGSPAKWSSERVVATGSRAHDSLFLADVALGGGTVMVGWGRTDEDADRQASVSVRWGGSWSVQLLGTEPVNQISVGVGNDGVTGLVVFQERGTGRVMAARAQQWRSGTWAAPTTIGSDVTGLGVSETRMMLSRSGSRAVATWLVSDKCCGRVLRSARYSAAGGWTRERRVSSRAVRSYALAISRQGRRAVAVFDHPADQPSIEAVMRNG